MGAAAIVCHHPHVPGAYEYHNGCPIFYSLGNVIFDSASPKAGWWDGFFVDLSIDVAGRKVGKVQTIPYTQHPESGGLRLLNEMESARFHERLAYLNVVLQDDCRWLGEWRYFVESQASPYLTKQYFPVLFRGVYKLSKALRVEKALLRRADIAKKLNLIQCDAHKDVLEELLRSSVPDVSR